MSSLTAIQTSTGEVKLSHDIINKYLVSGNTKVTEQEAMMFIALCKYRNLNPFLREAYIIKYSERDVATIVVGKETFLKRAQCHPKYRGHETGINDDGSKAWAKVHVEGYAVPICCEVDLCEYISLKNEYVNGKQTGKKIPNAMWSTKPRTMLKKVALVQALREAFTESFGGMYSSEEINTIKDELPTEPVKIEAEDIRPDSKSQSKAKKQQKHPDWHKQVEEADSYFLLATIADEVAFALDEKRIDQVLFDELMVLINKKNLAFKPYKPEETKGGNEK